jgi:hypothetical protein
MRLASQDAARPARSRGNFMFENLIEEEHDSSIELKECNDKKLHTEFLRRGEKSRKRYDPQL